MAFLSLIILFTAIAIPAAIIIFILKLIRRAEKRADERLTLEKEKTQLHKQQIQMVEQMNSRIIKIESLLETVE